MRTSLEVYQRVRWDPRFDATRFVLCIDVHDRVHGGALKRVALTTFEPPPRGDIPWHRVIAIEADGEIVWDRRTGVDRIDGTSAGRRVVVEEEEAAVLVPPFWSPRSVHRVGRTTADGTTTTTTTPTPNTTLRVVTWNTLWDRFDSDKMDTPTRRALLMDALERSNADVIALQEVETPLAKMLLDARWVRDGYATSFGESDAPEETGGLVLLSKAETLEVGVHPMGPHKAIVGMMIRVGGERCRRVLVMTVHLSSDRSMNGAERRRGEMTAIARGVAAVPAADVDVILLGDFNDGTDDFTAPLAMSDAWLAVNESVATFDPTTNPLAAIASLNATPQRLDRVLVRGERMRAQRAVLEGTKPTDEGLFPSDHFAVQVDLEVMSATTASFAVMTMMPNEQTTHRTALAWIPPVDLWPKIQAIREQHDPAFVRWPPHVNVLYPFVSEAAFEEAAGAIASTLAKIDPFEIVLEGVDTFPQQGSIWLDPATTKASMDAWTQLRTKLLMATGLTTLKKESRPHLTIAKHSDESMLADFAKELGRAEARVGELVFLSRRGDEPMAVRATMRLGATTTTTTATPTTATTASWSDRATDASSSRSAETIVNRIRAAVAPAVVHVAGSHRVGCALADADVDVVIESNDAFAIEAALRAAFGEIRRIVDARVPAFELEIDGREVDVVVGTDALARSSVTDADVLLDQVSDQRSAFVELARDVKRWARAKGIDSAPFGGVPSIGWLVLCAQTIDDGETSLAQFFARWAAFDWGKSGMTIMTPSPEPKRSCATQVSSAMVDRIVEEMYEGWRSPSEMFTLAPMHRRHRSWAVVKASGDDRRERNASVGEVRGRMRALISRLEEADIHAHAWPRPFEKSEKHALFAIGLGQSRTMNRNHLIELTAPWTNSLERSTTITIDWRDGGDVPSLI